MPSVETITSPGGNAMHVKCASLYSSNPTRRRSLPYLNMSSEEESLENVSSSESSLRPPNDKLSSESDCSGPTSSTQQPRPSVLRSLNDALRVQRPLSQKGPFKKKPSAKEKLFKFLKEKKCSNSKHDVLLGESSYLRLLETFLVPQQVAVVKRLAFNQNIYAERDNYETRIKINGDLETCSTRPDYDWEISCVKAFITTIARDNGVEVPQY